MKKPPFDVTLHAAGRKYPSGKKGRRAPAPGPVFRPYLYLAYGSNLNLEQFRRRCPQAEQVWGGRLTDHRLVFRGVADIVQENGSEVPSALYRITSACERALDRYEGFPDLYRKETLAIRFRGEVAEAMYYAMNSTTIAPPNGYYYDIIERGYRDWDFSTSFLEQARLEAEEIEEAAWRESEGLLAGDTDRWDVIDDDYGDDEAA